MVRESMPTGDQMDGEIAKLLDVAGLMSPDLQIFHDLRAHGFSTFVHGSVLNSELRDVSDVDFAIIGDFANISPALRDQLIPDADDGLLKTIDYISVSKSSAQGRRMSLHIEKPDFRDEYPNYRQTICAGVSINLQCKKERSE